MKKLIMLCAAMLAASCTVNAQVLDKEALKAKKEAVKAAKKALTGAETAINAATADPKNIDYAKVAEAESLVNEAMAEPEVYNDPKTWYIAGRAQCIYMNKMLQERQATGQMDNAAFFENQHKIVTYLSRCDSLEQLPDEKGNARKEVYRAIDRPLAKGPRQNLLIAGSNMYSSNPDACIKYMKTYFDTFDDPFFSDLNLNQTDTMKNDAYYILASAYLEKKDTASAIPYLEKAIESNAYGQNAIFNLMQAKKGNNAEWAKYCQMGYEKYPEQPAFYKNLYQAYVNDKKMDKAIDVLNGVINNQNISADERSWASYYKAATYYNDNKIEDAYNAFVSAAETKDDYVEAWEGAGNSAWKMAQNNLKNKAVADSWYKKAIDHYEKVRALAPNDTSKWGYFLYAIYNNSGNAAKAAQFKKYAK